MLRLSLLSLLLALFTRHALASCPVCGVGYTMKGSGSFSAGAGGTLSCNDLVSFAADRGPTTDVCYIIQSYARTHCGCVDKDGKPAPPLPFLSETVQCQPCGGTGGNDLWTMDPVKAEVLVDSGIDVPKADGSGTIDYILYCNDCWDNAMNPLGVFTPAQCSVLQNQGVRNTCGCALRDAAGNKVTRGNNPSPTPSPPNNPSPTPAPPSSGPGPSGGCKEMNSVCGGDSECCSGTCMDIAGTGRCGARRGLRGNEEQQE